ncbi:HPr family phosphocarrier protein [Luxibacter massiliensis]|uniref:HPr family phosphocarrier protein n=1 Tax=Luxibacter massiliensis TaxID=2219695 RepID=UPI000F048565|nr:HPr family phosphocarrier protein [Luxibacter massiliensis]
MVKRKLVISNPSGLHTRPAAVFARTAKKYQSETKIIANGSSVNGKSTVSILSAGLAKGIEIELQTEGDDEAEAMADLTQLLESGCGE